MHGFRPVGIPTLSAFTEYLERNASVQPAFLGPWDRLFNALSAQPGWGEKTAALFVKEVIQVHRGPDALRYFADVDGEVASDDRIYLPVDAVITHIFEASGLLERPRFATVNRLLLKTYNGEQVLRWDDLWYWGYFTQDSQDQRRAMRWNTDKFWCQHSSPVDREKEVQLLGEQFVGLVRAI